VQGFGVNAGVATPSGLPVNSLPAAQLIGQTAPAKDANGVLKTNSLRVTGAAVRCLAGEPGGRVQVQYSTVYNNTSAGHVQYSTVQYTVQLL